MVPSLFIPESHKLGERGQKQTKGFHFVKQPNKSARWVRQKLSTSQEEEQSSPPPPLLLLLLFPTVSFLCLSDNNTFVCLLAALSSS